MTQKSLNYEQMGIAAKDVFVQMGYRDASPDEATLQALNKVADLIRSEVNVKELQIVSKEDSDIQLVKKIRPNFKVLGKKAGKQMKDLAAAIGAMTQEDIAAIEKNGGCNLLGFDLTPEDVEIITEDMPGWLVMSNGFLTIALDIELTPSLIEEGIARELINRIQNLRKASGLEITDRIDVVFQRNASINAAVEHFSEYIASQVLANGITLADSLPEGTLVEDMNIKVQITKSNAK